MKMATDRIKIEIDAEEADKWLSSVLWRKCEEELPQPFVSVLAYVPDEEPLPTVHEGYIDNDGKWHLVYFAYQTVVNVHSWMPIPNPPKS